MSNSETIVVDSYNTTSGTSCECDHEIKSQVNNIIPSYKRPLPLWTQFIRFVILFLISVLILAAALLLTNARMPDPQVVRPLPDLLFELFPKVGWLEAGTNVCIFLLNATAVFVAFKLFLLERHENGLAQLQLPFNWGVVSEKLNYILFGIIDSGKRPYVLRKAYLIALIRFVVTYTIVMIYRAVVIIMTSYPATDNHCQHPQVIDHPFLNMFLTLVTLGSGAIHCGDLMFSGHTIILTLGFLSAWYYGTFLHAWFFRVWSTIIILLSFYCIIASRSHYTNDIVVAAYGTVTTFLVIRHDCRGAPWQMQILIRWWPCCGSNGPLIADGYGGEQEEEEVDNSINSNNTDNDDTNINTSNNIINNRINTNVSSYVVIEVDDSDERKVSITRDKRKEDNMSYEPK